MVVFRPKHNDKAHRVEGKQQVRRLFTASEARADGLSDEALRWGVRSGRWHRVGQGVYIEGPEAPTKLEQALAVVVAAGGVASGRLAGVLYELDSVFLKAPFATVPTSSGCRRVGVRRMNLITDIVAVQGFRCTDGVQTMIDLAATLDDLRWEQALESALRKGLLTISQLGVKMERLRPARVAGMPRMRRVLALRPDGAPPTESVLETLMVQLIRTEPSLPTPARQVKVHNAHGREIARVDLAWPEARIFLELDGQQHKDQPVYDANRQTAVVAAKGWLPGRFTWHDVVNTPKSTARRLVELFARATE